MQNQPSGSSGSAPSSWWLGAERTRAENNFGAVAGAGAGAGVVAVDVAVAAAADDDDGGDDDDDGMSMAC